MGKLSHQGMRAPQDGQKDRGGFCTLMPRGKRYTTTFKNDPTQAPSSVSVISRIISLPSIIGSIISGIAAYYTMGAFF